MRRFNRAFGELSAGGQGRDDVLGDVVGVHDGDRFVRFADLSYTDLEDPWCYAPI